MKTRKKVPAYRDGYVQFIQPLSSNISSFGAKKNTRTKGDATKVIILAFDRMSHRQQDMEFAFALDMSLDLKIRCPYHKDVNTRLQAIIDETIYDVFGVDPDANNMQMYVYMQENRKLSYERNTGQDQECAAGEGE